MRKKSSGKHNANRQKKRQKERFQKINETEKIKINLQKNRFHTQQQKNEYAKGFIFYQEQKRNFEQYNNAHRNFLKNSTKNNTITHTKRDELNTLKDICCSECSQNSQKLTSQLINTTERSQKLKIATRLCTLFRSAFFWGRNF